MAAHRYWRIWFDRTWGDGNIAVGELQLRATAGGSNWAGLGTPISSADFDVNHSAAKAFDGTATTRWASPNTNPGRVGHWLGIDLGPGVTRDLAQIVLTSRSDCCVNQNVKDCRIEWSDNGWWWVRDWALNNVPAWTMGETRTYTRPAPTNQPYWRIYGTQTPANNMAFSEVELRTSLGGANAATGGTAIASSNYDATYVPANAFDGNTATRWATSDGNVNPGWVGYQFASSVTIVQALVRARADAAPEQSPQVASLDASPDGIAWVVVGEWGSLTFALNTAYVLTTFDGAYEWVSKVAPSALMGSADKLAVARIAESALTGAGSRLAVSRIAESALTGALPWLSVSRIAMSVLIQPVLRARNGPVQIIGG